MAFIDSQFPTDISRGSVGGPRYYTTKRTRLSGRQVRNSNWTYPLHSYNAAYGIQKFSELEAVINFFHVCEGSAHGFRFKDWVDYKTSTAEASTNHQDMTIAQGDGTTKIFQLAKIYTVGSDTKTRIITKPVNGTVTVALDTTEQLSGWSLDYSTGLLTFTTAPGLNVDVKWGGQFDVPCHFMDDSLETSIEAYNAGQTDVRIEEIRI